MFTAFKNFIYLISYGPASISYIRENSTIYARIDPYNHYIINRNGVLYYMLPPAAIRHGRNAVRFAATEPRQSKVWLDNPIPSMEDLFVVKVSKIRKQPLFNQIQAYSLEQLINRAIEIGVLQIK